MLRMTCMLHYLRGDIDDVSGAGCCRGDDPLLDVVVKAARRTLAAHNPPGGARGAAAVRPAPLGTGGGGGGGGGGSVPPGEVLVGGTASCEGSLGPPHHSVYITRLPFKLGRL